MTNESLTTANLTNEDFSQKNLKWGDADFTWGEAQGKWHTPENIANESLNTATLTNEALS